MDYAWVEDHTLPPRIRGFARMLTPELNIYQAALPNGQRDHLQWLVVFPGTVTEGARIAGVLQDMDNRCAIPIARCNVQCEYHKRPSWTWTGRQVLTYHQLVGFACAQSYVHNQVLQPPYRFIIVHCDSTQVDEICEGIHAAGIVCWFAMIERHGARRNE